MSLPSMECVQSKALGCFYLMAVKSQATNPRDKTYGLLGILEATDPTYNVIPALDYSKSVADVFFEAAVRLLDYTGSIEGLRNCAGVQNEHCLPSWVPDWSAHRHSSWPPGRFNAWRDGSEYVNKDGKQARFVDR